MKEECGDDSSKRAQTISYFNESGSKIGYYEYKGSVGISGFDLMRMSDKITAVFEEFSVKGNTKDITVKTKVIALD